MSVKDFFSLSKISFCDISIGEKYMWRNEYVVDFAIFDNTLIMKETAEDYSNVFYFPIGKNPWGALNQIEKYCIENGIELELSYIDNEHLKLLEQRYENAVVSADRDWCDYIYTAEQFKTYAGKKLSGQRNHVNKFKKLYPNYEFVSASENDVLAIHEFLEEYKLSPHLSQGAREEVEMTHDYIDNAFWLNQKVGIIKVEGKIVALSIGEVVGDTLIVHVEKGLTAFEGVYPTMAQEFAKAFAGQGVLYINREEDCGEVGLRTSKTQYRPIEIKDKYNVKPKTLFERIPTSPIISTERLVLSKIEESDKDRYCKLYLDKELNRLWGYDYKQDLGDKEPTADYFYGFMKGLEQNKEEFSFAVRLNGQMIGEVVLHNFDYQGGVELGFRLFSEYQGKGYALESVTAVKEFAFNTLNAKKIKCKCFKQNDKSLKLIQRLGLNKTSENEKYFYFELTK